MKKIFLSVIPNRINNNHAGSKAIVDIEDYLNEFGFYKVNICNKGGNKVLRIINLLFNFRKILFLKNDLVLVQYPTLGGRAEKLISKLYISFLNKKNCETIVIIHDLECMRYNNHNVKFRREELEVIKNFKHIICHNNKMLAWLRQQGITNNCISLELFDYKVDGIIDNNFRNNNKTIAFPGNLDINKSGFIYKLNQLELKDVNISLYGPNYKPSILDSQNITYKGIIKPEDLPNKLQESFGLIWDGPELYSCKGNTGQYMKINNPHKLSLYMAAGLPVIVWKEAAIAEFVLKNNVGITISSLEDLDKELNKINIEKYRVFLENTKLIQFKVINGEYIKKSIDNIVEKININ